MRRALLGIATLAMLTAVGAVGALAGASPALAQGGVWWHLNSTVAPTSMPAEGPAELEITASDLGYGEVNTGAGSVTLTDELPPGVTPTAAGAESSSGGATGPKPACSIQERTVTCTFTGRLAPYGFLEAEIDVTVHDPSRTPLREGVVSLADGEASPRPLKQALKLAALREGKEEETPFGVSAYELIPEGEGGAPDTQAGSHPFALTTSLDFNQTLERYGAPYNEGYFPSAPALPRDLHFKLPEGLVGDPSAVPQCSGVDFTAESAGVNLCPQDTAVGVATVSVIDPREIGILRYSAPVFNLKPAAGEPARLGFVIDVGGLVPVVLKTAVPAGGEYPVQVDVQDVSQAVQVLSSEVTIWGVPGDPRHDAARGWGCLRSEGACEEPPSEPPTAFLTLPTGCGRAPEAGVSGDSWAAGPEYPEQSFTERPGTPTLIALPPLTGCTGAEGLAFGPSLSVAPETTAASTPTGLNVGVNMLQAGLLSPAGTAESALRDTTVTLPEGMDVNPSSANGLAACSEKAIGYGSRNANGILEFPPETRAAEEKLIAEGRPPSQERLISEGKQPNAKQLEQLEAEGRVCPKASKLGEVEVETPLLSEKLTGSVYLAEQDANPFGSLVALYMVFENPTLGVLVKLAGEGKLSEEPGHQGQVTTVFAGAPELSLIGHVRLHLFGGRRAEGGERAPVSTPARCSAGYEASSAFAGWSGALSDPFSLPGFPIVSGPGGGACPGATLPFSPSLTAGPTNSQAAGFSPFVLRIGQADGSQPLKSIDVQLPPGDSALLADVTPCSEAQALAEACGPESEIGHVTALAGLGAEPVKLPGQNEPPDPVYLTGPLRANGQHGASPFGILARVHAKAGPFDLGWIKVFSTLTVNPNTAAATVSSEPVPDFVDGVPADLKQLEVLVERPGDAPFTFNPTNCAGGLTIGGSLSGYEGGSAGIDQPFPVTGCAGLPFKPVLTAAAAGHASKANGTSFTVKVTSAGLGQANIAKVAVQIPKLLPSRLTTIQKACPAATFESTPTPGSACDEGSAIGSAIVHTPVLKNPVSGPAYLVSHGGAAFPDVEFVLQGEGVTLVVDGKVDIKNGITYTKFESVPDQPFTSFETTLPAGPHSALTANVAEKKDFDLCGEKLEMPTTIVAQNGATIEQTTHITIEGCGQVEGVKTKKLTRAQKLAAALRACRKKYRHSKAKRTACEKTARKRYGPQKRAKKAAAKKQKKH